MTFWPRPRRPATRRGPRAAREPRERGPRRRAAEQALEEASEARRCCRRSHLARVRGALHGTDSSPRSSTDVRRSPWPRRPTTTRSGCEALMQMTFNGCMVGDRRGSGARRRGPRACDESSVTSSRESRRLAARGVALDDRAHLDERVSCSSARTTSGATATSCVAAEMLWYLAWVEFSPGDGSSQPTARPRHDIRVQ